MSTKGEWTIKVTTDSKQENEQVEKLINAIGWNLPIIKTFKNLGENNEPKTLLEIYTGEKPIAE